MSVEIFGADDNSEKFRTLSVSSEKEYYLLWEPIIKKLDLKYIGDQRWLYKQDIAEILSEFRKIRQYVCNSVGYLQRDMDNIAYKTGIILDELQDRWDEFPDAERLWMG